MSQEQEFKKLPPTLEELRAKAGAPPKKIEPVEENHQVIDNTNPVLGENTAVNNEIRMPEIVHELSSNTAVVDMSPNTVTNSNQVNNMEDQQQEVVTDTITTPAPETPVGAKRGPKKALKNNDSLQTTIEKLQEKIKLLQFIAEIESPEIEGDWSKANRDILVAFQKDTDALKAKYVEQINNL